MGGLGIPNLRFMNIALRARWLWLQRVDDSKPWKEFNIQVPQVVRHLFEGATSSILGDGASTFFWTDRWLPLGRLTDIAPNLLRAVPKRSLRTRKVREGLAGAWLDDISPDLDALAIQELFLVADMLVDVALIEGMDDSFRWGWEKDFSYTAHSGYRALFGARVDMPGALQIWRSRAPPNCKVFLWLASRNRCWTADRLSRRGLPHLSKYVLSYLILTNLSILPLMLRSSIMRPYISSIRVRPHTNYLIHSRKMSSYEEGS
jgi:hypothetical protein